MYLPIWDRLVFLRGCEVIGRCSATYMTASLQITLVPTFSHIHRTGVEISLGCFDLKQMLDRIGYAALSQDITYLGPPPVFQWWP